VRDGVGFVEGDHAARAGEPDRLGHDLLRLGDVHEHEPGRGEVIAGFREPRGACVAVHDLDVAETATGHESARQLDGVGTALDADHASGRPHPFGERVEVAARPAAELDDVSAVERSHTIEQPGRLAGELLRLA
jgi:hypothetical protein